mmetsp:Transcript_29028/g.88705  ORF Transcript_29028/g.88705 Transcript_29028/m.88705 type:complete len:150 (-) Transcript_29028:1231-1680(-)
MASARACARDDAHRSDELPESPQNLRDDDADGDEDHHAEDDDGHDESLPDAATGAARWRAETMRNDARHHFRRYQQFLSKQHGGFRKFMSKLRDALFVASMSDVEFFINTLRGRGFTQEELATVLNGLSADSRVAHLSIARCARVIVLR